MIRDLLRTTPLRVLLTEALAFLLMLAAVLAWVLIGSAVLS